MVQPVYVTVCYPSYVAAQEIITQQPRMLVAGQLRDYQLVSLQWMISLYNNKLNGILVRRYTLQDPRA